MPARVMELREYGDPVQFAPTADERRVLSLYRCADHQGTGRNSRRAILEQRLRRRRCPFAKHVNCGSSQDSDDQSDRARHDRVRNRATPTSPRSHSVFERDCRRLARHHASFGNSSLISNGLRRGYVPRHEPLGIIRGRIDFLSSMRRPASVKNLLLLQPLHNRYARESNPGRDARTYVTVRPFTRSQETRRRDSTNVRRRFPARNHPF